VTPDPSLPTSSFAVPEPAPPLVASGAPDVAPGGAPDDAAVDAPWRRRGGWLIVPAVVIAGLCGWRMSLPPRRASVAATARSAYPPRRWELFDQHRTLVKFDRYLGRQPVLLRFFDAARPPQSDPVLAWLRDRHAEVRRHGWEVLAVSVARPADIERQERESGIEWPFPLLADLIERDPTPAPIHRRWGCIDPATEQPRPALFVIDRRGYVAYDAAGRPLPEPDPLATLARLFPE